VKKGLHILILAAGQGKRMKSALPKVLHKANGKPVLQYILDAAADLNPNSITVVIGHGAEKVIERFSNYNSSSSNIEIHFVEQKQQNGTGDAVASASAQLAAAEGDLLILNGDTPLITSELLKDFYDNYKKVELDLSVLTMELDDPRAYGRIVRNSYGEILRIVEQRDANTEELKIKEVNSGTYISDLRSLFSSLNKLGKDNAQGEYYLSDLIRIFREEGRKAGAFNWHTAKDLLGINNRMELAEADAFLRMRKVRSLMEEGVTIYDPQTVFIEDEVSIGRDTIIYPGVVLKRKTKIGAECEIHHYSVIENAVLGSGCIVHPFTHIVDSVIDDAASIGPFSRLRPGNKLGRKVKVGNFVEMKNTVLGDNSKSSHLTYLGDAEVGKNVNVGAGTITCNYDGWKKYKTVIKDGAFIGSNTEIVAPAVIGEGAVIAAGTTVTDDVPDDALAVSRTDQKNIPGWAAKKRAKMEAQNKKEKHKD
jgi:bifunctional UDP-N-acetylglucosamine pyrophosphorylase/glucosamine-1-phosphate N-acetyltransferase